MALIKNPFSKKPSQTDAAIVLGGPITVDTLKQLIPIRTLSAEKLQAFAAEKHTELLNAGSQLFKSGDTADSAIYLLNGRVKLSDQSGKSYEIEAGSAQAKFPLCSANVYPTTAIALTPVTLLRVSQKIMAINNKPSHDLLDIPKDLANNRLLELFSDHFHEHELDIPSLPDIAIQLRKAMNSEKSMNEIVEIIQLDPVIAAKLVEVANCPLYLTLNPAKNCLDAITRIGLNATRNLVVAFSTKQLFKSKSPLIRKHLDSLWKQSLYLSALSHVLAASSKQQNPDDALLAGLICDIGAIPFLSFVANLPENYIDEAEIEQAIPFVTAPVGATLLKDWGFAEDIIDVALSSRNWFQTGAEQLTLTDIVVLSRLHAQIGKKSVSELPAITAIPAAGKLKNISLSPENTLTILYEAKTKINEALSAFSS